MNPHFIFNSLMAIQSYIYKKEPVQAGDFLAKFADLVRITLENSRVEFVKLDKEIRMLKIFIDLQLLRFDNRFDYRIDVDSEIDIENSLVPPMMAQPFVENAIEHGLRHKKEKGNLKITFSKSDKSLLCTVEDDGVGREASKELEKKREHQSMATSITKERLDILSRKLSRNYFLEIEDLKTDEGEPLGTRIRLLMPFKTN
jgi:LytS/YehU family sensor histidine kinase